MQKFAQPRDHSHQRTVGELPELVVIVVLSVCELDPLVGLGGSAHPGALLLVLPEGGCLLRLGGDRSAYDVAQRPVMGQLSLV